MLVVIVLSVVVVVVVVVADVEQKIATMQQAFIHGEGQLYQVP